MSCECNCPTEADNYGRVDELEARVSGLETDLLRALAAIRVIASNPGNPHAAGSVALDVLNKGVVRSAEIAAIIEEA